MIELKEKIADAVSDMINDAMPVKEDPYVAWSSSSNAFYVSTTDDAKYDGYITISEIVDGFIEWHEHGDGGYIDERDAEQLVIELEKAVNKIKNRIKSN